VFQICEILKSGFCRIDLQQGRFLFLHSLGRIESVVGKGDAIRRRSTPKQTVANDSYRGIHSLAMVDFLPPLPGYFGASGQSPVIGPKASSPLMTLTTLK
jgi:hypothetical protein